MSWNSPNPVVWLASLAAAPKSAILTLWPVESSSTLPPAGTRRTAREMREQWREKKKKRETFQVSVNDPMFVEVDNSIDNLSGVVADDALSKPTKVMENLIQASSGHPLNEDVDVSFVLGGPQTADHIGVGESPNIMTSS